MKKYIKMCIIFLIIVIVAIYIFNPKSKQSISAQECYESGGKISKLHDFSDDSCTVCSLYERDIGYVSDCNCLCSKCCVPIQNKQIKILKFKWNQYKNNFFSK